MCDEVLVAARRRAGHNGQFPPHPPHSRYLRRPCHFPHKDIVVPPSPYEVKMFTQYLDPQYLEPERNVTFFFAGALPELSQEGQWKHKATIVNEEPWLQVGSGLCLGSRGAGCSAAAGRAALHGAANVAWMQGAGCGVAAVQRAGAVERLRFDALPPWALAATAVLLTRHLNCYRPATATAPGRQWHACLATCPAMSSHPSTSATTSRCCPAASSAWRPLAGAGAGA
jgi:hypothetical protein